MSAQERCIDETFFSIRPLESKSISNYINPTRG
jgi:hypothetical protein